MPPVEWIELGYQGYGPPQLKLFVAPGVDIRFSLLAFSLLLLLALTAPLLNGGRFGVFHPVVSTLTAGFNLPVLRTLERTAATYVPTAADGVSPLPLFVLTGLILCGIWVVGSGRGTREPAGSARD